MAAGEDETEAIVFDLLVIIVLTGDFVDARFEVELPGLSVRRRSAPAGASRRWP